MYNENGELFCEVKCYKWHKMCTDLYFDCSLHPNTVYTFRVAANNDVGSSNFSAASDEATTLQDSKLL